MFSIKKLLAKLGDPGLLPGALIPGETELIVRGTSESGTVSYRMHSEDWDVDLAKKTIQATVAGINPRATMSKASLCGVGTSRQVVASYSLP